MSGLLHIDQAPGSPGPLCPNGNTDERHRLVVKVLNAMYEAMDRDDDGEHPEDQDRIYRAARAAAPEYMRLFLASSAPSILGQGSGYAKAGVTVEAWFFKCPTCGLIVSADGVRRNG